MLQAAVIKSPMIKALQSLYVTGNGHYGTINVTGNLRNHVNLLRFGFDLNIYSKIRYHYALEPNKWSFFYVSGHFSFKTSPLRLRFECPKCGCKSIRPRPELPVSRKPAMRKRAHLRSLQSP
jgi:hypothetical protein